MGMARPTRRSAAARAETRTRSRARLRFGSDYVHLTIPPPVVLTPIARRNFLTRLEPRLDIDAGIFTIPPTQVSPATPVQLGVDLIVERASWYEPARNRLEMFDGNVYLRFVVSKPHAVHAATFAIAHQHNGAEFRMAHGLGVPASAAAGEGFVQEGTQTMSVATGSRYVGIVFTPRAGSWWIMLTSITKDFLWKLYWADVTALS
jgi:hypothetical protein